SSSRTPPRFPRQWRPAPGGAPDSGRICPSESSARSCAVFQCPSAGRTAPKGGVLVPPPARAPGDDESSRRRKKETMCCSFSWYLPRPPFSPRCPRYSFSSSVLLFPCLFGLPAAARGRLLG
ncbi:unnamed protein product, partial [Ectocarpus sp. 4 AP-2014]